MNILVIINPVSGSWKKNPRFTPEEKYLFPAEPEVYYTKGIADATRRTYRALEQGFYSEIWIAGGDGSINEVINGYMRYYLDNPSLIASLISSSSQQDETAHSNLPRLGILNRGSSNDFFNALQSQYGGHDVARRTGRVPGKTVDQKPDNPPEKRSVVHLDVMGIRFDHNPYARFFVNISSAGISGDVIRAFNRSSTRRSKFAFFWHSIRVLLQSKRFRFRVCHAQVPEPFRSLMPDDSRQQAHEGLGIIKGDFYNIFFCNGKSNGAGMLWAPQADPTDGVMEISAVGGSAFSVIRNSPAIYSGRIRQIKSIHCTQASSIRLETDRSVYLDVDGELLHFDRNSSKYAFIDTLPAVIPCIVTVF